MSVTTPGVAEMPPSALKVHDSRASKYATISNTNDENRLKNRAAV